MTLRPRVCIRCLYDLAGVPIESTTGKLTCPECGANQPLRREPFPPEFRAWSRAMLLGLLTWASLAWGVFLPAPGWRAAMILGAIALSSAVVLLVFERAVRQIRSASPRPMSDNEFGVLALLDRCSPPVAAWLFTALYLTLLLSLA